MIKNKIRELKFLKFIPLLFLFFLFINIVLAETPIIYWYTPGNLSEIYVNRAGDTMTGNLTAPGFVGDGSQLTNLPNSQDNTNIAFKNQSNTFTQSNYFNAVSIVNLTNFTKYSQYDLYGSELMDQMCLNFTISRPELDGFQVNNSICSLGRKMVFNSDISFDVANKWSIGQTGNAPSTIRADTYVSAPIVYTEGVGYTNNLTAINPTTQGIIINTVRSFWPFKYKEGVLAGTGLLFDVVNQIYTFQYLNDDLCHINLLGGIWCKNGANFTSLYLRGGSISDETNDYVNVSENLFVNGYTNSTITYTGHIFNNGSSELGTNNFIDLNSWFMGYQTTGFKFNSAGTDLVDISPYGITTNFLPVCIGGLDNDCLKYDGGSALSLVTNGPIHFNSGNPAEFNMVTYWTGGNLQVEGTGSQNLGGGKLSTPYGDLVFDTKAGRSVNITDNLQVNGNVTINNLLSLDLSNLTTNSCNSITNGSIARNTTGVYGCPTSGIGWSKIF